MVDVLKSLLGAILGETTKGYLNSRKKKNSSSLGDMAIAVNAYIDNTWLDVDVLIDGEYRGLTGERFCVDSGSHTVGVSPSVDNSIFHHFDGYLEQQNPITVSITSDVKIIAHTQD